MEVVSASLVPTLGKNFSLTAQPTQNLSASDSFSPQRLTFIQDAQKTCSQIKRCELETQP